MLALVCTAPPTPYRNSNHPNTKRNASLLGIGACAASNVTAARTLHRDDSAYKKNPSGRKDFCHSMLARHDDLLKRFAVIRRNDELVACGGFLESDLNQAERKPDNIGHRAPPLGGETGQFTVYGSREIQI